MTETSFWIRFALAVLATWRVTHLLANEDGPADLLVRCRRRLADHFWGKLMDCFHCLSFWVAAPLAFFVCSRPLDIALCSLALSGGACLLERLGHEPVVIRSLPEQNTEGGDDRGMLWPESGGAEKQPSGGDGGCRAGLP